MELWIPITIVAAFAQNVRSVLQKKLTQRLSSSEASYVRFCYAAPFAAIYLVGLNVAGGYDIPRLHWTFVAITAVGGLAQVLGTVALIASFSYRNFAVGTAYSKTETVQTALFGFVVLGDSIGAAAGAGILVSLVGVLMLSSYRTSYRKRRLGGPRKWLRPQLGPGGWLGVGAGAGFAVSAVCYRAASLSLPEGEFFVRAAITLVAATLMQTLGMGVYFAVRQRGALTRVAQSWRASVWVGLAGMLASAGWISAMTLERAAYVRALGQIELLFAFGAAVFFLSERVRAVEIAGAALVVAGLVLLLG